MLSQMVRLFVLTTAARNADTIEMIVNVLACVLSRAGFVESSAMMRCYSRSRFRAVSLSLPLTIAAVAECFAGTLPAIFDLTSLDGTNGLTSSGLNNWRWDRILSFEHR